MDTQLAHRIYAVVSSIPRGKVLTYGNVARKAQPHPRVVGMVLHRNVDPNSIPCHRVVFSNGSLTQGYAFGGMTAQREKLESEGVKIVENKIDLNIFELKHISLEKK